MIDWLIRRFVTGADNVQDPAVRTRYGQFAGTVGIICNVALGLAKGAVGLIAGSVSIVADAVNNLSDASSNVISLLGFVGESPGRDPGSILGSRGVTSTCPVPIVAALVLAIGFELVKSSIEKILSPTPVEFSGALRRRACASIAVALDGRSRTDHRAAHRFRDPRGHGRRLAQRRHLNGRRARLRRHRPPDGSRPRRLSAPPSASLSSGAASGSCARRWTRCWGRPRRLSWRTISAPKHHELPRRPRHARPHGARLRPRTAVCERARGDGRRGRPAREPRPDRQHRAGLQDRGPHDRDAPLRPHRHRRPGRERHAQLDQPGREDHRPAPLHPRPAHRGRPHAHERHLRLRAPTGPRHAREPASGRAASTRRADHSPSAAAASPSTRAT